MTESFPIPIIRSKLYQPRSVRGVINRERLREKNGSDDEAAVTLVSAPAGYGKTTFVSQFSEASGYSTAWLSLDPADSDLRQFLAYVVAALRNVVANCCANTIERLNTAITQSAEDLAGVLCNDLDRLDEPVILVLDDYHQIARSDVHDLVNEIIKRPPRNLRIVIITRRDPPLALQILRANGMLDEFRMRQLAFTVAETREFVRGSLGNVISDQAIDKLHERTEGWPVALRLAIHAVPEFDAADKFADRIPGDIQAVRDYLMQEVLATRRPEDRDYLLRTAFLGRFCAPLIDAVLPDNTHSSPRASGQDFITRISQSGLFTIALDDRNKWFRYHHLFQTMLREQALAELDHSEMHDIHVNASRWFENQGLVEEAISQLVTVDMLVEAAALIVKHRNTIMNHEQWHRLEGWLRLLPSTLIEETPELLLLRARYLRTRGGTEEAMATLEKAKDLLQTTTIDPELRQELFGSLDSTLCYILYSMSDGPGALAAARRALDLLPEESRAERGYAHIIQAGALQMIGDIELAKSNLYAAMSGASGDSGASATFESRVLISLGFVQWMDADLNALSPTVDEGAAVAESGNLREAIEVLRSLQASVLYQWNELAAMNDCLQDITSSHAVSNAQFHAQCLIIWSLTCQELGDTAVATKVARSLQEFALKTQNAFLVIQAEAFVAEIALRQGRMTEALSWATQFDPEPLSPMYSFYSPVFTFVKVLVLEDSNDSRQRVGALLDRLVDYLTNIFNKRFLIEALALRSMLLEATGETEAAEKDLDVAITMAQPGRFIRLFVDLGPRLGSLLNRLQLDDEALHYVGAILAAFRKCHTEPKPITTLVSTAALEVGVEPLSKRELQILNELADRLSNKEIADKLNISTVTVKRHAANIYQKLGVHGRRQAVAKAAGLGIFAYPD
jgi:LuxR family maltose regulon positive regulatory protein